MIGRIYDLYFGNPINYRKEFRRYYKKEFDNCEQYLVCRFNMSEELARKVCRNKNNYVVLVSEVNRGRRLIFRDYDEV